MKRMKGFTLVELLVVVVCVALLATMLMCTVNGNNQIRGTRDQASCMRCAAHLSGIYRGMLLYADDYNDNPPILPDIDQDTAEYADALRMGSKCTAKALGTGAQQNLCLLVEAGVVPWKMFICPSTDTKEADRSDAGRRYGLGETVGGKKKSYCDYGIQISYTHKGDNKCPIRMDMDGGIIILGDRAPEGNLNTQWSRNHPGFGENLLYAAGGVRWSEDKAGPNDRNTSGWDGNNVYTRDKWDTTDPEEPRLLSNGSAVGYPASTKDSVLYSWGD